MALNRQFMDFCLCYKIKNKSNINTGIIGGQAILSEVLVSPRPLAQQPQAARWPVVTPTISVVPSGPSSRPRTEGLRRLFPLPRKPVPGRLAERALSSWKCRKVPEEVGSNFQRISRGCGEGGNCGEGSPPLGGIFCPEPAAGGLRLPPLPQWPFLLFFGRGGRRRGRPSRGSERRSRAGRRRERT